MDRKGAKRHLDIIKAFAEGKTIEYYNEYKEEWITSLDPCFNSDCEYRVKPEPVVRPYKNKEEFLQAFKEHGPFLIENEAYSSIYHIIDGHVITYRASYSFKSLVSQNIHWCDGTKCGIIEE